jgi:hypothetical protein
MRSKVPPHDEKVARIAARQHGVATVAQLLDGGDEFRRYTYRDVFEDRRHMVADLRRLLQIEP